MNEDHFDGYVYMITCSVNNKSYVGITNNFPVRWNKHVYDSKHNSPCAIHRAMRKYDLEHFSVSIIDKCQSKEDLCNQEIFHILNFNTHVSQNGYNETWGGNKPMWGIKLSEKTKNLISQSLKGRPSPNKGKSATDLTREKLSRIHSKSVIQMDLNGQIIAVYKSIIDASQAVGIAGTNISRVCRGKKKTAKGYCWKYNNEDK